MASRSDHAGGDTDWEARYRSGDTPWDKGRPHPALVEWLKTHSLPGRILVPGCGAGHDVRALASNPAAKVVGVDVAPSAIQAAESFAFVGSETYQLRDFLRGEAGGGFDALFEHTCFCAIAPTRRRDYADAAANAIVPGGVMLAIFYREPGHEEGPPFGCTVEELHDLFGSAFDFIESSEGFDTFEGREERELMWVLRRKPQLSA